MISIANLLDAAKAGEGIDSDYRLAKVIGITHTVVSSYRLGKSMPNDKILSQLCALSGDDVAVVAAEIQAARAQSPEGKNMWLMIAKRLSGGASTAILTVLIAICLIATLPGPARSGQGAPDQARPFTFLYIVSITIFSVHEFARRRSRWCAGAHRGIFTLLFRSLLLP